jgi:hypothetical protein
MTDDDGVIAAAVMKWVSSKVPVMMSVKLATKRGGCKLYSLRLQMFIVL